MNPKRTTTKHTVTYKGNPKRILADFLAETLYARREWQYIQIFKMLKGRKPTTWNALPGKIVIQK